MGPLETLGDRSRSVSSSRTTEIRGTCPKQNKQKTEIETFPVDWGWSSVKECSPSMFKVPGSIP